MSDEIEINFSELINNKLFIPIIIGLIFALTHFPLINTYKAFWWDESQYLLMIKHLFLGTPTTGWWVGRSLIQSYLMYLLTLPFGFNELALKIINLLFSLGFVVSSYYLAKKLLNKISGVIVALLMTFSWLILFWSLRINIDMINALLLTISAYYYVKNKEFVSGLFLGLALNFRFTGLITGLIYIIHSLWFKKRLSWITGAIIGYLPLAINDLIIYHNPLNSIINFVNTNSSGIGFSNYYLTHFFNGFGVIIGFFIIIGLIPLFNKINKTKAFIILNLLIYLIFYSTIASVKDLRFIIHLIPFFFIISVNGMRFIIKLFTNNKKLTNYALIVITIIACYENYNIGLISINNVSNSYIEVKIAGLIIKNNGGGLVISNSVPQITYYSEQPTIRFPDNYSSFISEARNASWVVVSAYEKHPDYAYSLNQSWLLPVKALPEENPRLIIYLVNKSALN